MATSNDTIEIYSNIANAISQKYLAEIKATTAIEGKRPPFDVLMNYLQGLEKDLTTNAMKLLEQAGDNVKSSDSIDTFHTIINDTIESFVKQL